LIYVQELSSTVSKNQLMEFLQFLQSSTSIQEKLKQASDAEALAIVEIAKEAGFDIPVAELMVRGCWWKHLPQ
jgi:predicted ribosomally synthesized peptide with nif11-like leader